MNNSSLRSNSIESMPHPNDPHFNDERSFLVNRICFKHINCVFNIYIYKSTEAVLKCLFMCRNKGERVIS